MKKNIQLFIGLLIVVLLITAYGLLNYNRTKVEQVNETGITTLTGMLMLTTECGIPEGCGPKYQLWDSKWENFVPLLGNFTEGESEHIIRVKGVNTTLPPSEYGQLYYQGPKEAVKVVSYSVLNKVPYDDFLVNKAGEYTAKKYPCLVFRDNDTGGAFFTKWNKVLFWEANENFAILKVRMTNTFTNETPQPSYELWYNGNSGAFIKEVKYPDNAVFCP